MPNKNMKADPISAKNVDELRKWYDDNSKTYSECWVLCKKGKNCSPEEISYLKAVETALCYGWIDSTCKAHNSGFVMQRFSKRKKNSVWSELNKARVQNLENQGLMTEEGRKAVELAPKFSIDNDVMKAFEKNPIAWENFQKFPKLYQRVRIDTVQRDKKYNYESFLKKLDKLIENSSRNKMFGEWNDNGNIPDDLYQ